MECRFVRSIWSIIQVASNLYPPTSITNIIGNWLHGIDLRFRTFIRVGELVVIWSLWLCRNDKVFNDRIVLSCMLSTDAPVFFICGYLCSGWRITASLQRYVHDWRLQRWILFFLHGWQHNLRLVLTFSLGDLQLLMIYMYLTFFVFVIP
jgi:hypothetical protein